jgi:Mg-chelatase subunit ChlD
MWDGRALSLLALLLALGCGSADTSGGDRTKGNGSRAGRGGTGSAGSGAGDSGSSGTSFGSNAGDGTPMNWTDGAVIDQDASTAGGGPDNENCGGTEIKPMITMEKIPGNVLLVFDRSGSMRDNFPATGRAKWMDARDAVAIAITPLAADVSVGAIFFPHTPSCDRDECCVPAFGTAPQIDFMPGMDFLTAWDGFWTNAPVPDGSTPTFEALEVAEQALASALPSLIGTTTVVLITDGDPRCAVEAGNPRNPSPAEVDNQIAQLSMRPGQWFGSSVKTHVLGLPGADQPFAVSVLNGIATAGGSTQHISAADPATLQTELAKIIGESVTTSFESCTVTLPHVPPDPEKVVLVVVESGRRQSVARDLGAAGGWTLTADQLSIVLQGELCAQARAGAYDEISVVFGCIDLPPLDPPVVE